MAYLDSGRRRESGVSRNLKRIPSAPPAHSGCPSSNSLPKHGSAALPGPGRTGERDCHGETRRHATHASTTEPDARLARTSNGQASKLCHAGHGVMENRDGLAVAATTTRATGTAERDAGETMMAGLDRAKPSTLGAGTRTTTRGTSWRRCAGAA